MEFKVGIFMGQVKSPSLGVHGHKTAGEEAEPNLSC